MGAEGGERGKLERLCRYIARPAVSTERLALTGQGSIRYCAAQSAGRRITPAGRGAGAHERAAAQASVVAKHAALTWVRRLKRVLAIDIETCARCGGQLNVIAGLEDPAVIRRTANDAMQRVSHDMDCHPLSCSKVVVAP